MIRKTCLLLVTVLSLILLPVTTARADQAYRVQPGDTLSKIAREHGLDAHQLILRNPFVEYPWHLFPGQVLVLPPPEPVTVPGEPAASATASGGATAEPGTGNVDVEVAPAQPGPPTAPEQKYEYNTPQLLKQFANSYFQTGPAGQKIVALTFDDGPDEHYTARVLDILDRQGVKATFFLIGSLVERHPDVVQAIVRQGHVAAGHSWSHRNLRRQPAETVGLELVDTGAAIKNVTGLEPLFFRPPYGEMSVEGMEMASALGYITVGWSADSLDWRSDTADEILVHTLSGIKRGGIILMHSAGGNRDNTLLALPELIYTLKVQGFEFVTVDRLLGKPAYR